MSSLKQLKLKMAICSHYGNCEVEELLLFQLLKSQISLCQTPIQTPIQYRCYADPQFPASFPLTAKALRKSNPRTFAS